MSNNGLWPDRRTKIGYETAGNLAKMYNRQNYRLHPETQAQAVEGSLDDVGNFDAVKVSVKTGQIVDGHLRVELALLRFGPDYQLPVDYYDKIKHGLLYLAQLLRPNQYNQTVFDINKKCAFGSLLPQHLYYTTVLWI